MTCGILCLPKAGSPVDVCLPKNRHIHQTTLSIYQITCYRSKNRPHSAEGTIHSLSEAATETVFQLLAKTHCIYVKWRPISAYFISGSSQAGCKPPPDIGDVVYVHVCPDSSTISFQVDVKKFPLVITEIYCSVGETSDLWPPKPNSFTVKFKFKSFKYSCDTVLKRTGHTHGSSWSPGRAL